jgi:PAS domain S-box-containing protein
MRGKSPREILNEEDARHVEAMYRRCVNRREPLEYEEELSPDDTTRHWRTRIAPVVVEGTVRWIVGSSRDITERKRRKEVLERQNDLFTKAQTMANIGAGEYNVQTGEGMVTNELKRMHGLSPDDELTLERSISFYHPEDQPTIREAFTEAVEAGEPYDLELRLITADDEHRWVHTRGEPQEEDGEIVRVRGTIQDVTERVRRREQLEAAKERAEEADRIKSALLSNMNHEFRTPLTSIISFSELISDNPDVAGQFADRILGGGKRLLYTLNTVMDFAELEAGDRSVTHRRFQLREVVRSVANEFRARARRNGIDLSIDLPDDLSAVTLDQHRVERILTHLVHNAVKFTDDGSVGVCVRKDDSLVELRVEDTGVGIDPDFQDHVFDEFAQQSSGYDRSHEGNGLGLTIVKRLVEEMEGQLDLSSAPGEGTRVTVWVPEGGGGERRPHQ